MKKQYLYISLLSLSIIVVLLFSSFKLDIETSFTDEEMQEIYNETDDIVTAFTKKEMNKCRRELMEMVDAEVDTMLMFHSRDLLRERGILVNDSPPRPVPPSKPELLIPNDDTPLQPLIENEEKVFEEQNESKKIK
ncbi:MAG: hypothetical protein ACI94Y_000916 [Maribacter sp.]|jgi:hypothetical protein